MNLAYILESAIQQSASDIFLIAGLPLSYRKDSIIVKQNQPKLTNNEISDIVAEIYTLNHERSMDILLEKGEDDFSFSVPGLGRFRADTFRQRGSLAAVIRVVSFSIPNYKDIGIPETIMNFTKFTKGLVLITGAAGSGKSTTLACMVDKINSERASHIITMEDPIEYVHHHKQSIVTQREIGNDTETYALALRAALRQSPDVLLVGEMRDLDTIEIAMTAAETGQLVLSTLHTVGAANTINRILDIFPARQQQQIRVQLSMVLQAVISQQLIPTIEGSLIPVFEIMRLTPAIRNMIRENNVPQINSSIFSGAENGMITMDQSLLKLFNEGKITQVTALKYAVNPNELEKKIQKSV